MKATKLKTRIPGVERPSVPVAEKIPGVPLSRRLFLRNAAAAWATVSILPGRLLGAGNQVSPSRQVSLGFIGVGRRGGPNPQAGLLTGFVANPKCRVLAVCDVNRLLAEQAKTFVDEKYGNRDCAMYRDFRELLARDDIDAVVIAAPTHWHAVMTIMACQHGKDVYCEKPLAHTVRQGRAMVEAARRYGRVVQNGTQTRSSRKQQFLCRLAREGKLRLKQVYVGGGGLQISTINRLPAQPVPEHLDWDLWVGPGEWRPYHDDIYDGWRLSASYGGFIAPDLTAHSLDVAQSALGTSLTGPVEIHPPQQGDQRQLLRFRYANGVELIHHIQHYAPTPLRGLGTVLDCEEGVISIAPWDDTIVFNPPSLAARFQMTSGEKRHNVDYCSAHFDNFLDCIRTRRKPNADVEIGQRSLTLTHLACISYRLNRPLRWDPAIENFVNDAEASRHLDAALRAPWRI